MNFVCRVIPSAFRENRVSNYMEPAIKHTSGLCLNKGVQVCPRFLLAHCRPRFKNGRVGSDKNSHQKTNPDPSGNESGLHISIWSCIGHLLVLVASTESLHHHFCCSLHRLGIHLESTNSKPRRSDFGGCKKVENMEILLRLLSYVPD